MKIRSLQQGVGLIEVLITVLLLSTSLLALSSLQLRSLQFNNSAYLRSQANIYAYDIIDRMRVVNGTPSDFNRQLTDPVPTGNDAVALHTRQWLNNLTGAVASAKGAITCDNSRNCSITITWDEQNASSEQSEDSSTFKYSVRL